MKGQRGTKKEDLRGNLLRRTLCASRQVPTVVVLSSTHQEVDLALKSPSITVNNELDLSTIFRRLSKLLRKTSNAVLFWLGDL